MPITLRDIAERVGVSVATVSRVLNKQGDPFISEATRERVNDAARAMGYRPNAAARALATGRTRIIMLATAGVYSPYYALVARNVTRLALENGYLVTTVPHPAGLDLDEPPIPTLHWPADGVILADTALPPGIAEDLAADTPLVGVGVYAPEEGDSVSTDLHYGALEAMRHLIGTGRRRIAYLFNSDLEWVSDPRTVAYQATLDEAGLPAERIALPGASRADARQFVAEYVRVHGCPEAIFCKNDDMAIGCYRGLRDVGLRIPEDVALVGCDGIEDTEYLDAPLSTIVQPVATMCRLAWEFLERRMAEPRRPPQRAVLRPEFHIRASSAVRK